MFLPSKQYALPFQTDGYQCSYSRFDSETNNSLLVMPFST